MKPAASSAARPSSASAKSSAPGLGSPSGTTRSRSPGFNRGRRRRRNSSTAPATRKSFGLGRFTLQPLADHDADRDQGDRGDEPGDEPFRDGADVTDRPAAAIVG